MRERQTLIILLYSTLVLSIASIAILLWTVVPQTRFAGDPYPRLGMWWLNPYEASVEDMGRYHLLIDSLDDPVLADKLALLKLQAPYQRLYKPIGPTERQQFIEAPETGALIPNPEVKRLPSDFFISQTGTELTYAVDAQAPRLVVDQLVDGYGSPLFQIGGTVMIGRHESAKVIAIDKELKTLTVERGFVRPAQDHTAGTRIASHISFWPGTWLMNMTDQCPRQAIYGVKGEVNYSEYYLALALGKTQGIYPEGYHSPDNLERLELYDGLALDRLEDSQSFVRWLGEVPIQLDLYHQNRSTEDREFDGAWQKGVKAFVETLRAQVGDGLPLIRNNPLSLDHQTYSGQIYETSGWSEPSPEWWTALMVGESDSPQVPYLSWPTEATVLFEVYEDERFPTAAELQTPEGQAPELLAPESIGESNYQRMRFGLTSALMGDGYFSYEVSTAGHGSLGLLWFDEYDLGTGKRGYLGYPKDKAQRQSSGVYLRRFNKGIAVVNPTDFYQTVELGEYYQHFNGKQQPEINSGEVVHSVTLKPYDGVVLLKLPLLYQWLDTFNQFTNN